MRWHADIGAAALWSLTFNTTAYHEGWNGAAGVSLLGFSGASVIALFRTTHAHHRSVRDPCRSSQRSSTVHYFRYTFPAAVMLIRAVDDGAGARGVVAADGRRCRVRWSS